MVESALVNFQEFRMPAIHRHALVMHSAKNMYDLVNDVSAYSKFLPDCQDVKVIEKTDIEQKASLLVGKGGITKWFTTHNKMCDGKSIEINLVDGPFKKLTGTWQFQEIDEDACKVILDLEFEFSSKLIAMAFGSVFSHMANNMVKAFVDRASKVYTA